LLASKVSCSGRFRWCFVKAKNWDAPRTSLKRKRRKNAALPSLALQACIPKSSCDKALVYPSAAAFSPDGKWLAACGSGEGLLLNLQNCELRFFPALSGLLVAFTPDSRKVLVVRRSSDRQEANDGLLVFDLSARQTGRFPVEMSVPHTMEVLADGKTVRIRGVHGNPAMHVPRMGTAEETIRLDTGKTERDWGPVAQKWMGRGKDPRLAPMPAATLQMRTHGPRELYWNEASGLCLLDTAALWEIRYIAG
jgi:hypothetical protein